jgi:hypothetical protein
MADDASTPALQKFKIVTRGGQHYDIIFPGDMRMLLMHIKAQGEFMNPQLWVPLVEISHVINVSSFGEEAGANVVPMFQGPTDAPQ